MAKSEVEILTDVVDNTRQLTRWYLSKLKGVDVYKTFTCEGVELNPVIWLVGHLAFTENWLLVKSTGGEGLRIPGYKLFTLGSELAKKEDYPPYEEVWAAFKAVHEHALAHLATLTDSDLDKPNTTGFQFAGENSIRSVIKHAARHEGSHAGHLGWLCKLHGVKTV